MYCRTRVILRDCGLTINWVSGGGVLKLNRGGWPEFPGGGRKLKMGDNTAGFRFAFLARVLYRYQLYSYPQGEKSGDHESAFGSYVREIKGTFAATGKSSRARNEQRPVQTSL